VRRKRRKKKKEEETTAAKYMYNGLPYWAAINVGRH